MLRLCCCVESPVFVSKFREAPRPLTVSRRYLSVSLSGLSLYCFFDSSKSTWYLIHLLHSRRPLRQVWTGVVRSRFGVRLFPGMWGATPRCVCVCSTPRGGLVTSHTGCLQSGRRVRGASTRRAAWIIVSRALKSPTRRHRAWSDREREGGMDGWRLRLGGGRDGRK